MPQELKANRLLWLDILTLYCIIEHTDDNHSPVTKRQLFVRADRSGLINQFIQQNSVDPIYARPLTSDLPVQDALNKLRRLGFLETVERQFIAPTAPGRDFIKVAGTNWRRWPVTVPIDNDGQLRMKSAIVMTL
jgi:hypothetical protein